MRPDQPQRAVVLDEDPDAVLVVLPSDQAVRDAAELHRALSLAAESAALLARRGFRVLLTDRPVPTPCASWHVKARALRGGVAITASGRRAWAAIRRAEWKGWVGPAARGASS